MLKTRAASSDEHAISGHIGPLKRVISDFHKLEKASPWDVSRLRRRTAVMSNLLYLLTVDLASSDC